MAALLASSLVTNYSQEEIDVFYDATSKLTLRGGYRYVWGDANDAVLPPAGLMSSDQAKLRRNVGIGGVTFRPSQKIIDPDRRGSRLQRRRVFPHQLVRLSEGPRAGALSGLDLAQPHGGFYAARQ